MTVPWTHCDKCQMGNGIHTDHPSPYDDPGVCCLESRIRLHQMPRPWPSCGACSGQGQGLSPWWRAAKVLADFWLEDEEAYKARNKYNKAVDVTGLSAHDCKTPRGRKLPVPSTATMSGTGGPSPGRCVVPGPHAHDFPLGSLRRHICMPIYQVHTKIPAAQGFPRK